MRLVLSPVALTLLFSAMAAAAPLSTVSATCSGEYGSFYGCTSAIDGIINDTVLNGSGNSSYWLGRQTTYYETLTVDLGRLDVITGFDIYNTDNGQNCCSHDRGTLGFMIWVSSVPVTPDTNPSSSFGSLVLNSTLIFYTFPNYYAGNNPVQTFSITPVLGRYVTFRSMSFPVSYAGSGLSELDVNGFETPEPGSGLLMAIAAVAICSTLRRRAARG